MSRIVRAAVTQTRNAYADMPASVDDMGALEGHLDDVRNANLDHHVQLIESAAEQGVGVFCMGELFTGPYFALTRDPLWFGLAEPLHGPTFQRLGSVARERGMVLVAPIYEEDPASGKRFNTALVIDADGTLLGRYRKLHIPEGSNEKGSFNESFYYEPGDGDPGEFPASHPFLPVFKTAVGRIGVAICYDRHFEGVISTLAAGGAEIVFCPAVTFGERSEHMWAHEFQVEAGRHNVYIGGSNRIGTEPPFEVEFFGGSYFTGPSGRLDPVGGVEGVIAADLDLDALQGNDGSGWNLKGDARTDSY